MLLSNRVKTLQPSPTLAMSAKATQMKSEGFDIINLSVGEPDFNTPKEACDFGIEAINKGETKYTAVVGINPLKKAIQNKFKKENNLNFELDEIFVSSGAKQAIFNGFAASLNAGDEVIIPSPYWVSYAEIVEIFEGTPVIVKTEVKNNFKLTAQELEKAITKNTKWLLLNSPSNPTGEVYSEEELKSLAQVLIKNPHVYIMSDDIYEHLVFDGMKFKNILNVAPQLAERVFVINGVSKSYSMTGFRVGYGAMKNTAFIKKIVNLQSQSTSNACSVSQKAALGALEKCDYFLPHIKKIMEERRNLMFEGLSQISELEINKPSGAFYLFFGVKKLYNKKTPEGKILTNDEEVSEYFLTQGEVATVFGSAFGYPDFIRVSYAVNEETLKKALEKLKKAINLLSK
jgi:aspartate aminotransferase